MVSIQFSLENRLEYKKRKDLAQIQFTAFLGEFRILQEPSQSVWLEVIYYNLLEC